MLQTDFTAVSLAFPLQGGPALNQSQTQAKSRLRRLSLVAALIAVVGVGIAAEISYVHSQIAALGQQYTSFCNINSSINCDKVLSSSWSKVAGVPVAWMALFAYAVLASLFWRINRLGFASRRFLVMAAGGCIGSVVFSVYMAAVSAFALSTICLLCTSLYVVSVALAVVCFMAARAYHSAWPEEHKVLSVKTAAGFFVAAVGVSALAAVLSAPPTEALLDLDVVSLDEIKSSDPKFYDWYLSQPKVDSQVLSLAADEQSDKLVTIVDYSDFQCGHCRRNWILIQQVQERRADLVHFVHRHFPLDSKCNAAIPFTLHASGCRAAEAGECALRQDKHDAVAAELFENQGQLFESNIFRLAKRAGVDVDQFESCMSKHEALDEVVADTRSGEALNLTSTPTLFLNGRKIVGTFKNVAEYERAILIEAALAAEGAKD